MAGPLFVLGIFALFLLGVIAFPAAAGRADLHDELLLDKQESAVRAALYDQACDVGHTIGRDAARSPRGSAGASPSGGVPGVAGRQGGRTR